jgi:zinc D-Ala-D-Ala dipeptidase
MWDFSALTRDPENFVPRDNWALSRPLPEFADPARLPLAPPPHSGEKLVEPEHPRVINVNAYRKVDCDGVVPAVWVRQGVAEKLYRVADSLPEMFGLAIFDGWRSLQLQRGLLDVAGTQPATFEEPSADPGLAPSHLTGAAVDVTLTYDMEPLALGTAFGVFGDETATRAFEHVPGVVRDLRRLLYWSMAHEKFVVAASKWWHFEYGTRRWAVLTKNSPIYGATS